MICAISPAEDNYEENLGTLVIIYFMNFILRDMQIKLRKLKIKL
jgi:hypothetical protein